MEPGTEEQYVAAWPKWKSGGGPTTTKGDWRQQQHNRMRPPSLAGPFIKSAATCSIRVRPAAIFFSLATLADAKATGIQNGARIWSMPSSNKLKDALSLSGGSFALIVCSAGLHLARPTTTVSQAGPASLGPTLPGHSRDEARSQASSNRYRLPIAKHTHIHLRRPLYRDKNETTSRGVVVVLAVEPHEGEPLRLSSTILLTGAARSPL